MRGSVVKRGNGYSVVVELDRDPITDKRRQKWHSGFRTKREAERALSDLVASLHAGTYIEPTKQTLAGFAKEWLVAVEPTIRPSTHHSYDRNLRLHVLPHLGSVELRRVDAGMLNALYAALLADGKLTTANGGSGGLSPRSVRYIHTIIHRAFRDAVRWGRIARNPADAADPPRASAVVRPTMTTWTADQVRAFLDHTAEHRLHAAFVLLATTGMRRGEALGLRWSDIDLAAGRASISQTVIMVHHDIQIGAPKTARGRRTVALDPGTVTAVREHRRCFAVPTAGRCIQNGSPVRSHASPPRSDCRPSGFMIFGIPGPPWRCLLVSIPRSFRSASGMPTCRSPWTSIRTSVKVCTVMPHPALQA
ncbi:MAG: site-specific recombinase XerD [Propionibacteriaceae bacterium]|nr:site-specific recombinase XerD [Propionibacteriaceae bacterium]